jgi:RHS repeat-associated protein
VAGKTWTFSYDAAGNMTGYDGTTYTYLGTKAVSGTGSKNFSAKYDPMGNLTALQDAQNNLRLSYDLRGQLVTAIRGNDPSGVTYQYNDQGRRIMTTTPDGLRTVYVSRWFTDVLANGASSPVRTLIARRVPFAQWGSATGDGSQMYVHTDALRSTVLATNSAGATVGKYTYTPMGELQTSSNVVPRYLFTSKEMDSYSRNYWMGSRFYNPRLGRFYQADSQFGGPVLRLDAMNDNAYVLNNPSSFIDPSGHSGWGIASGVCSIIGGGVATSGALVDDKTLAKYLSGVGGSVWAACGILTIIDSVTSSRAAGPQNQAYQPLFQDDNPQNPVRHRDDFDDDESEGDDVFFNRDVVNEQVVNKVDNQVVNQNVINKEVDKEEGGNEGSGSEDDSIGNEDNNLQNDLTLQGEQQPTGNLMDAGPGNASLSQTAPVNSVATSAPGTPESSVVVGTSEQSGTELTTTTSSGIATETGTMTGTEVGVDVGLEVGTEVVTGAATTAGVESGLEALPLLLLGLLAF